jgi:hypothetical protein
MPEQGHLLPNSFTLNGVDCFLLQLDKLMWQSSGKRNVCTFVVTLPERLAIEELHRQLAKRRIYQWLCRLRLREGLPFCLSKWVLETKAELPVINEYQLASEEVLPDTVLSANLDIKTQSAFKIDLLHVDGAGSILVFTWHHVLMDAHGGEMFVRYLGAAHPEIPLDWLADDVVKLPLKVRANIASEMKQFLFNVAQLPVLSLYKKMSVTPQARYCTLSFTPQQMSSINNRARQLHAGFMASAFYLAATANAVAQVQKQRGDTSGDVLVPIPLDRRKRGAYGPILGNQVSFLFYRIPNRVLQDVSACTSELIEQMKSLMRTDNPGHYTVMLDFLRRMPGFFYRRMLKAPTKGLMASFFYSDTGDSLQHFDKLFGQPVSAAIHYPPNLYPPGMTFIFSRFQGALQLTLGYMEPVITAAEVELLLSRLADTLLGEKAS